MKIDLGNLVVISPIQGLHYRALATVQLDLHLKI